MFSSRALVWGARHARRSGLAWLPGTGLLCQRMVRRISC